MVARKYILAGLTALAVSSMAGAAEAQTARANTSVNLRSGPGTSYAVITTIPTGSIVEILGCTAGFQWCGVNYAGTEGYAAGRYLTVISGQYSGQLITAVGVGVALSIPLWRYDYWRPKYYHRPGHRPPGWRPPGHRPPGHRPPGSRPPKPTHPIERPGGGRPPGARPPRPTQPIARPPGNRPPGMSRPGRNKPGRRPVRRGRR